MNKTIAAFAAASMLLATNAPAFATDYGRNVKPIGQASGQVNSGPRRGGKAIGVGLAVGVGVAPIGAAIANRAHANKYQGNHYGARRGSEPAYFVNQTSGRGGLCRVWRADCRNGIDRGCFKYERNC